MIYWKETDSVGTSVLVRPKRSRRVETVAAVPDVQVEPAEREMNWEALNRQRGNQRAGSTCVVNQRAGSAESCQSKPMQQYPSASWNRRNGR